MDGVPDVFAGTRRSPLVVGCKSLAGTKLSGSLDIVGAGSAVRRRSAGAVGWGISGVVRVGAADAGVVLVDDEARDGGDGWTVTLAVDVL